MKKHLLNLTLAFFLLMSYQGIAQVSTFPYTEDFESPSLWQGAPASCDATVAGGTFTGWTQDPNDDGDWRADTAGTTSIGTGPGAGRNISGAGTGMDANPGTTGGTYIYTEGTFGTGTPCGSSSINIISPFFDVSAPGKAYQAKFNYHMLGVTMGSLHIDARIGANGSWSTSLWSQIGEKDSAWVLDSVNLANYTTDSLQIRIRAVMGNSWSSDIAFDNFVVDTFLPASAEAILVSAQILNLEYPLVPLNQFDSLELSAAVRNEGTSNINQTSVDISEGLFSTQVYLGTILPFTNDTANANAKYFTTTTGIKEFTFTATISESDAILSNNYDTLSIEVSDTVLGRENLPSTINSLGVDNFTIEMGQKFTIGVGDTATSISFFIVNPTVGDSARVVLRSFNQTPGALLETSSAIALSAGSNWYTLPLNCFKELVPGEYFAAVEQLNLNNLTLGTTDQYFTDTSAFYQIAGNPWTAVENNIGNPFFITFLVRLNFGHYDTYREVNISSNLDTICEGGQVIMTGDANASYSWAPANLAFSPSQKTTIFSFDETTTITATTDFGCGLTATDSKTIHTTKAPSADGTPDTTICNGTSITLQVTGGTTYRWLGGPANQDWLVTPTSSPQIFTALIDSSNGCQAAYQVSVTTNSPTITAFGDTAVCTGESVTVSAAGTANYQWRNGPSDSLYSFDVNETQYALVVGTDEAGCTAMDSVLVTENQSPELIPMNDTGACITKFITLRAGGVADKYLWNDGSTNDSLRFQVFTTAKTYTLIAENNNGCKTYDTVFVDRYLKPNGSISPASGTLICEGSTIDLTAGNGATYEWSTGETNATITAAPTEATKYEVIIRSAEGCEDFKEVTISLDPLPTSAFRYQDFQDSVVFSNQSSLATSYSWDFGDGNTSTDKDPYNIYDTSGMYTITLSATNDCGTVDSSITISVTVPEIVNGLEEIAAWQKVQVYPVPAQAELNLKLENQLFGDVTIQLFDMTGKLISTKNDYKSSELYNQSIDLGGLQSGVYTLQVSINGSTISSKVTKQ